MKFLTEYRDPELAMQVLEEIKKTVTKPWKIMEVCGGQTHSLVIQIFISFCKLIDF
jgi:hydrogenase expression/formation protein HypD